jgi:hypothetical protein
MSERTSQRLNYRLDACRDTNGVKIEITHPKHEKKNVHCFLLEVTLCSVILTHRNQQIFIFQIPAFLYTDLYSENICIRQSLYKVIDTSVWSLLSYAKYAIHCVNTSKMGSHNMTRNVISLALKGNNGIIINLVHYRNEH